ncbi:MAG: hypothetical protein SFV19_10895 [Rhodospirillaceae bacterium]|nr:hypothetical protein [Rhodospirillaceae bacterium]
MSAFLLSRATGRAVLIALAAMAASGASFSVLIPPYQEAAGFTPFDMQFPLTRDMVIIQLGAFNDGVLAAYLPFAAVDMFFPAVGAAFTVLLWGWLARAAGAPWLTGAFRRGWWIWAIFPALCDLSENVLFLRLLAAEPRPTLDLIDTAVAVHRAKLVFLSIAQGISVALILVTMMLVWRQRGKS